MKIKSSIYVYTIILSISCMHMHGFEGDIKVYDARTHKNIGIYQRLGSIDGYESGIVRFHNQTFDVVEKPTKVFPLPNSLSTLVGYIKNKNTIREFGNFKRTYLYKVCPNKSRVETECIKRKHHHLIP